jgi:hypothetical protein
MAEMRALSPPSLRGAEGDEAIQAFLMTPGWIASLTLAMTVAIASDFLHAVIRGRREPGIHNHKQES